MTKPCKYCGGTIRWKYAYNLVPVGERNLPLNEDGSEHRCRNSHTSTDIKIERPEIPTIETAKSKFYRELLAKLDKLDERLVLILDKL
ncbi:MAG: hypothetical protein ACW99Q_06475 [Candidatus Kariarchaeaceae archaeon]|jgi:hypothetical protein